MRRASPKSDVSPSFYSGPARQKQIRIAWCELRILQALRLLNINFGHADRECRTLELFVTVHESRHNAPHEPRRGTRRSVPCDCSLSSFLGPRVRCLDYFSVIVVQGCLHCNQSRQAASDFRDITDFVRRQATAKE